QIHVIPYQLPQASQCTTATTTATNSRQGRAQDPIRPFTSTTITSPTHDLATATLGGSDSNALLSSYASSPWPPLQPLSFQGPQTALQAPLDFNVVRHNPEDNTAATEKASWEHHGPWSWMSVCS